MKIFKILLTPVILIIISLTLYAQETTNTFSKTITDLGASRGVTVEQTIDGGFILTGVINDGKYGGNDAFLIKTDIAGNIEWSKTYGGSGNDNGWAVRQTSDQGYIMVGYSDSYGNGDMDVLLIKTDSEGNEMWSKIYGGEKDEYGWDVRITKDRGFIIASQTESFGNGEIDAYFIKVDKSGNEEWSKNYGGEKTDRIFSVQQTPDGGYAGAGITYSYTSISPEDRDGYLLKVDSQGDLEWHKTYGEDLYDVVHSIDLTSDNGYFLTGYGESHSVEGYRDAYLIKTDALGNIEWLKAVGTPGEERGIKGIQTIDGGYVVIGMTSENRNLYLVKSNSMGVIEWTRNIGEHESTEFGYTVKETKDRGFILIGHTQSNTTGKTHIILIKTDANGQVHSE